MPARLEQMTGLHAEERNGLVGFDRGAHDLASEPVDTARQVHRDHRQARSVDRVDRLRRHAFDGPVESGTEECVDDEIGFLDDPRRQSLGEAGPRGGGKRRVAGEFVAAHQQADAHLVSCLREYAGRDETVAAVVAGAGHHRDPRARRLRPADGFRHRQAGALHEREAARARRDRQLVGARHLGRRQHFCGVSDDTHRATIARLTTVLTYQKVGKTGGPLLVYWRGFSQLPNP
jgi:hypothetical protein